MAKDRNEAGSTALRKLLISLDLLPYGQFAQLRGHWALKRCERCYTAVIVVERSSCCAPPSYLQEHVAQTAIDPMAQEAEESGRAARPPATCGYLGYGHSLG